MKSTPLVFNLSVTGDLRKQEINTYVSERYYHWKDYADFYCTKAGFPEESTELLDEVLLSLLQKDQEKLQKLYLTKRNEFRDLDYFILRMIKLNVYSATAPYRHRIMRSHLPIDRDIDFSRLKIADEPAEDFDYPAERLKQMRLIRYVFNGLDLNDMEKEAFQIGFMLNESIKSHFPRSGCNEALRGYNVVSQAIHIVLFRSGLTSIKPKMEPSGRVKEIVDRFLLTHKIKHKKAYV